MKLCISFHEYAGSMITESVWQENQRKSDFLRGGSKHLNLGTGIPLKQVKTVACAARVEKPALSFFSIVTPARLLATLPG